MSAETHELEQVAAAGRQRLGRDDFALLRLVADVGAQRVAIRSDDRKLFDRCGSEGRLTQCIDVSGAAGIDAAGREVVERRHRALNARLGQHHMATPSLVELFPALPFDPAAEPNVERCHGRSRQDHANSNRSEQFSSRRHQNSTHNCGRG